MIQGDNGILSETSSRAFTSVYMVLSVVAVVSNSLVLMMVIKNKKIRTARNIFIFNLALSDLILAISLPFTILDKLSKSFPFSHQQISCRLVRTVPCVAAFMSSLTVITVALDRRRVILRPHQHQVSLGSADCPVQLISRQVGKVGASLSLPVILSLSCLLASPVFIKSQLVSLHQLVVSPASPAFTN